MSVFNKILKYNSLAALLGFGGLLLSFSCTPVDSEETEKKIIAEVYDRKLYVEDLEGLTPYGLSANDSSMLINAYIDTWMQDASLMHEASQNMPGDLNIDELVKDYKESLILHNYEKVLISEFLDSLVTVEELESYYEDNIGKFTLKEPLLKVLFIKILTDSPDLDELKTSWEDEDDISLLLDYCNRYAHIHMLDNVNWQKFSNVEVHLPPSLKGSSAAKLPKDKIFSEGKFTYLLKISDVISDGETAPFEHASIQAKKVILHQRRVKLLNEKKKNIFQEAVRKNQVKTFYD